MLAPSIWPPKYWQIQLQSQKSSPQAPNMLSPNTGGFLSKPTGGFRSKPKCLSCEHWRIQKGGQHVLSHRMQDRHHTSEVLQFTTDRASRNTTTRGINREGCQFATSRRPAQSNLQRLVTSAQPCLPEQTNRSVTTRAASLAALPHPDRRSGSPHPSERHATRPDAVYEESHLRHTIDAFPQRPLL